MGKASAHEAQYAAGLIRAADRRPNPPRRMGRVAILCAALCCFLLTQQTHHGTTHSLVMSCCVSDHVGWRHSSQQMVAPGACALHQQLPSTLEVRHPRQSPPLFQSFVQRSLNELSMSNRCAQNLQRPQDSRTRPKHLHVWWTLSSLVPHARLPCVHSDASSSQQPVGQHVVQDSASFRCTQKM